METAKLKRSQVTKELYDSILPEYRDIFFSKEEYMINNKSEVEESSYSSSCLPSPSYKYIAERNKIEENLYKKASMNIGKAIRLLVSGLTRLNQIQCSSEKIKRKLEEAVYFKNTLQLDNIIFHYRRNSWLESADSNQFSFIINVVKSSHMIHLKIDMDISNPSNPKLTVSGIYMTEELYLISTDLAVYDIRTMRKIPCSIIRVLDRMAGRSSEGSFSFI